MLPGHPLLAEPLSGSTAWEGGVSAQGAGRSSDRTLPRQTNIVSNSWANEGPQPQERKAPKTQAIRWGRRLGGASEVTRITALGRTFPL